MLFYTIKIIHIISSGLLFGIGLGTLSVIPSASRGISWEQQETHSLSTALKRVNTMDWLFTAIVLTQPITGFVLIYLKEYTVPPGWWPSVLLIYSGAVVLWFGAVYCRARCALLLTVANSSSFKKYQRYLKIRFILSLLVLITLSTLFYFMTNVNLMVS